jgi:hypothetical protein
MSDSFCLSFRSVKKQDKLEVLTNSVELITTRDATSSATTRQFPSILWNPKFHYLVHKSSPTYLFSARQIEFTTSNPISQMSILMLSIHPRLGLPSGLIPSGFPTNKTYTCSSSLPFVPHVPPTSSSSTL